MTDSDDVVIPDAEAVARELRDLTSDYPAFRFRTQRGWDRKRLRWVAERIDGLNPGLHTLITTDLTELHAALAHASATTAPKTPLTREAAMRAIL